MRLDDLHGQSGVVLAILPNVVAAMIAPTHGWLATATFLEHLGG
jgi:hypothetical protein